MTTPTHTVGQRLIHLADEIEPSSESGADRLRSLGAAINGGHYADIWASADIFQLINPDTIAEQVRTQGSTDDWFRILELIRNALVFAPIAVTWIGIWHALESYSQAIQAQPDLSSLSFLYLWQQGFQGRSITLSTIALIDGTLLVAVFLLTLIVLWHNNQRDRDAQQVHDELVSVLAEASLALGHKKSQQAINSVQMFERVAQELLGELRQERLRIQDLANRREKESTDMSTFVQHLMSSTQGIITAMQTMNQIPQQMEKVLLALASSFQQLSLQQKESQKEFALVIHQSATQLKSLTEIHQAMSNEMQTMGATLQAMGTNLSLLIQNLSGQQQDFVSTTSLVATQFKHLTEAQKTIGINLQTMLINMETMSVDLRTTVGTMQATASETARAASQMGTLLPSLLQMQKQLLATLRNEKPTEKQ